MAKTRDELLEELRKAVREVVDAAEAYEEEEKRTGQIPSDATTKRLVNAERKHIELARSI